MNASAFPLSQLGSVPFVHPGLEQLVLGRSICTTEVNLYECEIHHNVGSDGNAIYHGDGDGTLALYDSHIHQNGLNSKGRSLYWSGRGRYDLPASISIWQPLT